MRISRRGFKINFDRLFFLEDLEIPEIILLSEKVATSMAGYLVMIFFVFICEKLSPSWWS